METNGAEILLVEDSETDVELTVAAMNGWASKVFVVRDGAEALDYVFALGAYAEREGRLLPKLILLDLDLPHISGLEVLRCLKSDERTKHIPIVVLTSAKEHPYVEESYRLGANSYVMKPVNGHDFSQVVLQLIHYWMSLHEPVLK